MEAFGDEGIESQCLVILRETVDEGIVRLFLAAPHHAGRPHMVECSVPSQRVRGMRTTCMDPGQKARHDDVHILPKRCKLEVQRCSNPKP